MRHACCMARAPLEAVPVIALRLDAAGLARSRFAISPLHELVAGLLAGPARSGSAGRMNCAELPLLASFAGHRGGYIADFLTPLPDGPTPSIEEELEAVATTPPDRVDAELAAMRNGRPVNGLAGAALAAPLVAVRERGARAVAEQAASELRRLWTHTLAARWSEVQDALDSEVDLRARDLVRGGSAALLNSLHPRIGWRDDTLSIEMVVNARIQVPMLVIVPSLVGRPTFVVDPVEGGGRVPVVVYPVTAPLRHTRGAGRLGRLLGPTRADLLAALAQPATTKQLAERHYLSQATVSYHLGVLYDAGLVTRTRSGRAVIYRQTSAGADLLRRAE